MSSVPIHTGETNTDRAIDRWSFVGILVGCVAYGLHIVLAIACVRAIRRSTAFADYPRRAHVAIAYVTLLFTVATLNIGVKSAEWVMTYIDNRSSPLGPAQYLFTYGGWPSLVSDICTILSLGWVSDLVLMWRAWALWNQSIQWIALPLVLVYLANAALSIVDVYGNGWMHKPSFPTLPISLAYLWMWLGTNIILTALIVVRLLWMSRHAKQFASSESAKQYVLIAAMVLESGLPLTVVEALYVGVNSKYPVATTAIYPLWMQFVAISPELIVWRVAKNRSHSESGSNRGQVMAPAPLKALRGESSHDGSRSSALVFKKSTRTDQTSTTALDVPSPLAVVSDMQECAGEIGLRRTHSNAFPVMPDPGHVHDTFSRGGYLERGEASNNAGRTV